jgi:hypothetical protein
MRRCSSHFYEYTPLVACVRRAPRADIYYIDAFSIRASNVRDDGQ